MILGTLLKYDRKIKLLDLSKNYFHQYIYNIFKGLIMNSTLEILTLRECEIENNELKEKFYEIKSEFVGYSSFKSISKRALYGY